MACASDKRLTSAQISPLQGARHRQATHLSRMQPPAQASCRASRAPSGTVNKTRPKHPPTPRVQTTGAIPTDFASAVLAAPEVLSGRCCSRSCALCCQRRLVMPPHHPELLPPPLQTRFCCASALCSRTLLCRCPTRTPCTCLATLCIPLHLRILVTALPRHLRTLHSARPRAATLAAPTSAITNATSARRRRWAQQRPGWGEHRNAVACDARSKRRALLA